jgi:hypothetical protein
MPESAHTFGDQIEGLEHPVNLATDLGGRNILHARDMGIG